MINMHCDEVESLFDGDRDYTFSVTVDSVEYIIVDNAIMSMLLETTYGDRLMFYGGERTLEDRKERFLNIYNQYKRMKQKDFEYIVKAYYSEYSPIANVDGKETVTSVYGERKKTDNFGIETSTTTRGNDTVSNEYGGYTNTESPRTDKETTTQGAQEVSNITGDYTDSTNYGVQKLTDSMGLSKTDTQIGAHIDKEDNSKVAMNNPTDLMHTDSKSTNFGTQTNTETVSAKTDTHTTDARTDTTTHGSHTDTSNIGEKVDETETVYGEKVNTMSEKTDTFTNIYGDITSTTDEHSNHSMEDEHTDTVTTVRIGNIGVTMTQQLITAEMQLRSGQTLAELFLQEFFDRYTVYC